ncbi:MAG: hypothetical protein IPF98_22535 [Gemmatimonadetes bacterium]|nr:hypothetical protein [Gemmatimonadota bacterium]
MPPHGRWLFGSLLLIALTGTSALGQDRWHVVDRSPDRVWYWYATFGGPAGDGTALVRMRTIFSEPQRVDSVTTSRHREQVYHVRCGHLSQHLDFTYWFDANGEMIYESRRAVLHWLWTPMPPHAVLEQPAAEVCARPR